MFITGFVFFLIQKQKKFIFVPIKYIINQNFISKIKNLIFDLHEFFNEIINIFKKNLL